MKNTFTHGTRELRENLQPATHFIEVFSDGKTTNQEDAKADEANCCIYPINNIAQVLKETQTCVCKTIAIFKIREKKRTLKAGDRLRCIKHCFPFLVGKIVKIKQIYNECGFDVVNLCEVSNEVNSSFWPERPEDKFKSFFNHFELITE